MVVEEKIPLQIAKARSFISFGTWVGEVSFKSLQSHTEPASGHDPVPWERKPKGKGIGTTVQILPALGWLHDFLCLYYNNFGVVLSSEIIVVIINYLFVLFA